MIHDEKTTELELPIVKPVNNIVRVDFKGTSEVRKMHVKPVITAPPVKALPKAVSWWRNSDLTAPWIVRLLAVFSVVLLSLLII